ncbi:hypothetical protein ALC62_09820, partial [Cyphomyrmex costatus]
LMTFCESSTNLLEKVGLPENSAAGAIGDLISLETIRLSDPMSRHLSSLHLPPRRDVAPNSLGAHAAIRVDDRCASVVVQKSIPSHVFTLLARIALLCRYCIDDFYDKRNLRERSRAARV